MAKAGLSFGSPILGAMDLEPLGNPYDPAPDIGIGNLIGAKEALGTQIDAEYNKGMSQFTMPEVKRPAPTGPNVLFDPQQNKLFVNGSLFDLDDADSAVKSRAFLDGPRQAPPSGSWQQVTPDEYGKYIKSITDPTLRRRFAENFETGMASLRSLFGAGAVLVGADEYGLGVMERAEEDIRKNRPFAGEFTDIGMGDEDLGPVEWFVGVLGAQGPMLLETLAAAGIGFVAGSAAAPGLGSVAGTVGGLFTKGAFKKAVKEAADEYAVEKAKGKAAAKAFMKTDKGKVLKRASGAAGALGLSFTNNFGIAASDTYSELLEAGVDVNDFNAKMTALTAAVPYALLDTIPEFVVGAKIFGGIRRGTKGGRLRRGATGAGVGGALEGITEAGQEGIIMGATSAYTGREYESNEVLSRLVNSFAAGAAIGGTIGGVANLKSNKESDLLAAQPTPEPEPTPPGMPEGATQQELFSEDTDFGTAPPPVPTGPEQLEMFAPEENLGQDVNPAQMDLFDQPVIPSQQPGFQMELPFGQQRLMAQPEPVQQEMELVAPVGAQTDMFSEQSLPLPPADPIPPTPPQPVENVVDSIQQTAQVQPQEQPNLLQQRMQEAAQRKVEADAEAQRQAELQAENERIRAEQLRVENERIERNNRELLNSLEQERAAEEIAVYEAEQAGGQQQLQTPPVVAAPVQNLPTVPIPPAPPRQQDLFRGQVKVPRPSRAEQKEINKQNRLRRKQEAEFERAQAEAERPMTPAEARAAGQGILFTQRGEPSVAALKAAGTVEPATPELVQTTPAEEADVAAQRYEGTATDELTLFRAGAVDADPAPDGFMYLANDKRAAQGGAKQPVRRASVQFDNLLETASRNEFDSLFNVTDGRDATRADVARAAGYDGVAFNRNPLSKAPWKEYLVLNPDTVTFIDEVPTGAAKLKRGQTNAVQEQSAESVDGGQQARPSEAAGSGDTNQRRATTADRAQERLREAQASAAASRTAQAQEATGQADSQQGAPQDSVQERVELDPDTATNAEIVDDLMFQFDSLDERSPDAQSVANALMNYAYWDVAPTGTNAEAVDYKAARAAAKAYVDRTFSDPEYFTDDQIKILDKMFFKWAITAEQRSSTQPWYEYAARRGLVESLDSKINITGKRHKDGMGDRKAKANNVSEAQEENSDTMDAAIRDGDETSGQFFRVDNDQEITTPINRVAAVATVKSVLRKMKVKPTVTVVRNQNELRDSNPELYSRAVASRPAGDFDTTPAAGFSVGDQVIIFTDRIKTDQQLRFILAHEALGHFGMKSMLSQPKLDKLMNDVFEADSAVRAKAMRRMEMYGEGKTEAVEEVLADMAAVLDVHILKRVWYAIKDALEALGASFEDDLARYLLRQSRRNLLQGDSGLVSMQELGKNLKRLQTDNTLGRFSVANDSANLASVAINSHAYTKRSGDFGGLRGAINSVKRLKDVENITDLSVWAGGIAENLQSLDNLATRSDGLQRVFNIFQARANRARRFLSNYETITSFSHQSFGGASDTERLRAGQHLAHVALHKLQNTSEADIRNLSVERDGNEITDLVVINEDGVAVINDELYRKAVEAGTVTREEIDAGISRDLGIQEDGSLASRTYRPTKDGANDGEFEAITDNEWRIYQEQRQAVNQSALDVVRSTIEGAIAQKESTLNGFQNLHGMTAADVAVMRQIMDRYVTLYKEGARQEGGSLQYKGESVENARTFLREVNRALFNKDKVQDFKLGRDDAGKFQGEKYQGIIDGLDSLSSKNYSQAQANKITSAIGNLYLLDVQVANAQFNAKRTIMTAYVPFTRRGDHQIRLVAVDSNGEAVKLDEVWSSVLPYYQAQGRADAREIAENLESEFGKTEFTIQDASGKDVTVTFRAVFERTRKGSVLGQQMSFTDFANILSRLDVNINPQERERIVEALSAQTERVRRSLNKTGVAGWDQDVLRSTSEYLETQGHIAGQAFYRHRLNEIMLTDRYWRGDQAKLNRLYKEATETVGKTPEQIRAAQTAYDKYAYMYQYMAAAKMPEAINRKTGKPMQNLGKGEVYRETALSLQQWFADSANINNSTEDLLSGETGSQLKMWTVIAQLGGSFATAFINMVSMVTHSVPYLGTYNEARGFGGGFGIYNSAMEMQLAMRNMLYRPDKDSLADAGYTATLPDLTDAELKKRHGITRDEAIFLADATSEGVLQAAQANALVGTARGGVHSNKLQGAIKGWMYMFSYTEQLNRRATALAAFRLHKKRAVAGTPQYTELELKGDRRTEDENIQFNKLNDQFNAAATEFARDAVNTSQGEYGMFNRPEMARGNIGQYLFIYKQFSIITIQMLKGMSPQGRLYFIGMLVLMSGLKGIPFADDLMDLVDSLLQFFNIKMASVEEAMIKLTEELVPGSSPLLMRGILDQVSAGTFSTRLGFGDMIPLTGALRAGADTGREIENFFGPVFSGLQGAWTTASNFTKYGAGVVGIKDQTMTFSEAMRDIPVAALRGLNDAYTYYDTGVVTNAQGKVIDPSADWGQITMRALGFYPSVATRENDIVRLGKYNAEYIKALRAQYTGAYVKAYIEKDLDRMLEVEAMVRDWNFIHRGTRFEFKDFKSRAKRSAKSAAMPTGQRYLKTAPKILRDDLEELMRIYDLNDEKL